MRKRKTTKPKVKKSYCVKITPSISKAFRLSELKQERSKSGIECLYVEIYDESGNLVRSGCIDNGCSKAGWCEYEGGKRCNCHALA